MLNLTCFMSFSIARHSLSKLQLIFSLNFMLTHVCIEFFYVREIFKSKHFVVADWAIFKS